MKLRELREWGRRLDEGLTGDPTLELADRLSNTHANSEIPSGEFRKRLKDNLVSQQELQPKFEKMNIKFAALIGIIILVFSVVALYPSEPVASSGDPEWTPMIKWADLDQDRLAVEIKLVAENPVEPFHLICPFEKLTLKTASGEVISTKKMAEIGTCWLDEDKNIIVAESFKHDLVFAKDEPQTFVLDMVYLEDYLQKGQDSIEFEVLPSESAGVFEEQVVVKNGIEARLVSIEINQSTIYAEFCFDLPSTEAWFAFLRIEEHTAGLGTNGGFLTHGLTTVTAYRCSDFIIRAEKGFDFYGREDIEDITIAIDFIVRDVSEDPSPEMVEESNQRSALYGVRFDSYAGDHTTIIEILSKPEDMSDEEAYQIARDALKNKIVGPWSFTVPLP